MDEIFVSALVDRGDPWTAVLLAFGLRASRKEFDGAIREMGN
jgi:hypothetical protein